MNILAPGFLLIGWTLLHLILIIIGIRKVLQLDTDLAHKLVLIIAVICFPIIGTAAVFIIYNRKSEAF